METKINETLEMYKKQLARKERIISAFREKQSNAEDLTPEEMINLKEISTEINMLKKFIRELNDLLN
jgi:predicted transglutaminase-like cysteine proteinase